MEVPQSLNNNEGIHLVDFLDNGNENIQRRVEHVDIAIKSVSGVNHVGPTIFAKIFNTFHQYNQRAIEHASVKVQIRTSFVDYTANIMFL
jgi:hypothetical protein